MPWMPNYSNPIYGLEEIADRLQRIMQHPPWARRLWLRESDRFKQNRFLYRYQDFHFEGDPLSMRKAEDFVVESRLYLPSPKSFNDPYEFQARIILNPDAVERRKHFRKVGKRMGFKGKRLESTLAAFMQRTHENPAAMDMALQQQREKWGIACFSLNPRSLRMWSHYAAGHSGVCFMFDPSEDVGFAAQTLPVNYQSEIATLHWPEDQDRVLEDVLLRKWEIWREEEEVRYASQRVVNAHLPLSPSSLKGVIVGNRFPDSAMPALNELLRRRKYRGYPRLRLYRADRFADRYGMYIRRLSSAEMSLLPNA